MSIANDIRTKVYGKDVREAIALGVEQTEAIIADYNAQVINAGNSNAEIVDARGGEINLKAKLSLKRDKTVKINATADFDDETKAQITGVTPITYSPTPLNNSITPEKVTFIKRGKNLFDKSKANIGYFINSDGATTASDIFDSSNYIPVTPNELYIKNGGVYVVAFYNSSKVCISTITSNTFTIPSDCYYVRFTMLKSETDTMQLELGQVTTVYEAYKEALDSAYIKDLLLSNVNTEKGNLKILLDNLMLDVDNLNLGVVDSYSLANSNRELIKSVNMFDKERKTDNALVSHSTGLLSTATDWYTSDYIQSKAGEKYTINLVWYIAYYDINKKFISGANLNPQTQKIITTPLNCCYFRFSYYATPSNSQLTNDTMIVNLGDAQLPYYSYNNSANNNNNYDSINLSNKIYGLVGAEINIYFDNLISSDYKKYDFNVVCDIGKQQNERWTCIPSTAGTYSLTLEMYLNNVLTQVITTSIIVKNATVGDGVTKKLLMIGDSTTATGVISYSLSVLFGSTDVMNLTLLGTKGTIPYVHEGRAGWKASNYITLATDNAFYNPNTDLFDFTYYMTQQSYTNVDYVSINLGINDTFIYNDDIALNVEITNILARYQIMIDSIHTFNANIKIAIAVTIPPSYNQDSFGAMYSNGQTKWRYKRNNFMFVKALINQFKAKESQLIYLLPINTNLDTQNNMVTETVAINSRNTNTIVRQSNSVHPAGCGYDQIADVFYYFIKSFEN